MTNELQVISPKSLAEADSMARSLAPSALLGDALKGKPADVLAVILTGAELGLAPMQAIRGIVMIKGRPTLYADTIGALVMSKRDTCEYLRCVETTDERATYEAMRKGHPTPVKLTYTMAQARTAGLTGNQTYAKHPAAMLRARCLAAIARMVFPDLVAGLYAREEELDDEPRLVGEAATPTVFEPTPNPKPSPIDAQFAPVDPLAEFKGKVALCTDADSLNNLFKAATKSKPDAVTQAEMVKVCKARKAEIGKSPSPTPIPPRPSEIPPPSDSDMPVGEAS